MAQLLLQQITREGLHIVWEIADHLNGDTFENNGDVFIVVSNLSDDPHTLTFTTPVHLNGLHVMDRTDTIPAHTDVVIGPFPVNVYSDEFGIVQIVYSPDADLRIAAIQRPD